MKYYTKEWYYLMQLWGLGDSFKKIPDKIYTDMDIQTWYDKLLQKEIASEKKSYNTPPVLHIPNSLFAEPFNPDDWSYIDEDDIIHRPESPEEVRSNLIAQHEAALEAFQNRDPFDPEEVKYWFRESYRAGLRNARGFYPKWLSEEVDPRLIALNLLPETSCKKYKKELRKAKAEWNRLNRGAERAASRQQIPESIREMFQLHDACLQSFRKAGKNYEMLIRKDGAWQDDQEACMKILFRDAIILEKDPWLRVRKYKTEDGTILSNTTFLYHELYNKDHGYEIHMMFWTGKAKLAYLTVWCSDVICLDGDKITI